MNATAETQPDLIPPPAETTRYWRIDSVHGKGRNQSHRYLCTVASRSQSNPDRLASACGFTGPFHCVEMTAREYAASLQRVFS